MLTRIGADTDGDFIEWFLRPFFRFNVPPAPITSEPLENDPPETALPAKNGPQEIHPVMSLLQRAQAAGDIAQKVD